jgi:16S rRNA (cytosine967-C5)-methyltransferase
VEVLMDGELARAGLSKLDRALCQELVYGIVRWQRTLDWLITRRTDGRRQGEVVELLLQLGLYQIFWLERIPAHASVFETVELAKRTGWGSKTNFVNAVLRGCLRERETLVRELEALRRTDPATGYSHPTWMVERWQARWGVEKTARLLEWNNSPPPTYARRNGLRTGAEEMVKHWQAQGVGFAPRQWDWTGENIVFELQSHPSLADWEDFQRGNFYVQDPSTLLAVQVLDPQPGEEVLDLCASPGGKTAFIADRMANRGKIVAQDLPPRLARLRDNCARLGASCAEIVPNGELAGEFDRVLVDAPCSNSGVLRRRVDARWKIQAEQLPRLHGEQVELLRRAAARVKPGGRLVYSTCSLEPEENEEVARAFLAENGSFKLERERQLLPFVDGVDGAYVASFQNG